ncbi:MAG: hypothetical protein L0G33_06475 [Staphylococcus equorum]|nr:hypothetical protein [Staphylococcus equorum]
MKSFLLALGMFITASLSVAFLSDAVRGVGIGFMLALITYVFFEYEFFQIKKDCQARQR